MKLIKELFREIDKLMDIAPVFLILVALLILRNWYNKYRKRNYRDTSIQLNKKLEKLKKENKSCKKEITSIENLKTKLNNKSKQIYLLEQQLKDVKQEFYTHISEKEREILKHKETNNHQQKAYERYVNYKNIEANNTRLGAHFIKNVISQIYEDLEEAENNQKSFLGIYYKSKKAKSKLPSLKALKSIFKLLDYNVSALHKEKTSLNVELQHIEMFLDLIKYLKPNTTINLENKLTNLQKQQIEIKPTLFFPFVENALKHGSLNQDASFISIVLKENNSNQLSYCLVNSAEQRLEKNDKIAKTSNFGLMALQQVLHAYYPKSKLEHKALPNNQYLSELTISLN